MNNVIKPPSEALGQCPTVKGTSGRGHAEVEAAEQLWQNQDTAFRGYELACQILRPLRPSIAVLAALDPSFQSGDIGRAVTVACGELWAILRVSPPDQLPVQILHWIHTKELRTNHQGHRQNGSDRLIWMEIRDEHLLRAVQSLARVFSSTPGKRDSRGDG